MKVSVRQVFTLVLIIVTIAFNSISQILPLNNQTSAEIANRLTPNYFLPANYVFSIWGLIYVLQVVYGIYQVRPSQRDNPTLNAIAPWFWVVCFGNMIWLTLFHYDQFLLSTVAMAAILISLITIYLKLRRTTLTRGEYWAVSVPMSVYFGWITVATVANVTYVLLTAGWDGFGVAAETWGAIMIVVAGLIGALVSFQYRDLAYGGVFVWAYVGLIARHGGVGGVVAMAALMAGLIALAVVARYLLSQRSAAPLARM